MRTTLVVVWAVCCGVVWAASGTALGQEGPKVSIEHRAKCRTQCKAEHGEEFELAEASVSKRGWLICACASEVGQRLGTYKWAAGAWSAYVAPPPSEVAGSTVGATGASGPMPLPNSYRPNTACDCPAIPVDTLDRIERNTKSTSDGVWALVAIEVGLIAVGVVGGVVVYTMN